MPDLTPEERAEYHRLKNIEQVRAVVEPIVEQKVCAAMGITWQPNGSHWDELNKRAETNRAMREDYKNRQELVGAAKKSAVEKITGVVLMLFAGTAGGGFVIWLAGKFHLPVPGPQP